MQRQDAAHTISKPRENVVFIGIDAPYSDTKSPEFIKLKDKMNTAERIIERLQQHIMHAYQLTSQKHPYAKKIIVAWREYLIADPEFGRSISNETKKLFKKTMRELVKACPKLYIQSGGTATRKLGSIDQLEIIKTNYQALDHISQKEPQSCKQIQQHQRDFGLFRYMKPEVIIKIQNRSHAFTATQDENHQNLEIVTKRISKKAPFNETINYDNELIRFGIYDPGSEENMNSIIEVDSHLSIGVELCREHFLRILKDQVSAQKKHLGIQIVMSDSVRLYYPNLCADNVIYLDSSLPAQYITTVDNPEPNIFFYRMNFLADSPVLEGPIPPIVPLQKYYLDYLSDEQNKFHPDADAEIISDLDELKTDVLDFTEIFLNEKSSLAMYKKWENMKKVYEQSTQPARDEYLLSVVQHLIDMLLVYIKDEKYFQSFCEQVNNLTALTKTKKTRSIFNTPESKKSKTMASQPGTLNTETPSPSRRKI